MAASSTRRLADHRVGIKEHSSLNRAKELARKRAASKLKRELKGYDCLLTGEIRQDDWTPQSEVIQVVNLTNTGSGSYNRVGRKIFMRSARIRAQLQFRFSNDVAIASSLQRSVGVRIALVYDRQPSGVLPVWGDIFANTDNIGDVIPEINSALNFANTSRFYVLRDFMVVVDPPFLTTDGSVIQLDRFVDEYVDLQELETVYSGDSTECTIADISSGALYFMRAATADSPAVAESEVRRGAIRLRYTD